jgi:HAD superfamily hydrolase (TIGR01509 family)
VSLPTRAVLVGAVSADPLDHVPLDADARPHLSLPAAVLFDMDGLLIDTEPLWFEVETAILTELGASWTYHDHAMLVGSSLSVASSVLADRAGSGVEPAQIADQLLSRMASRLRRPPVLQPGIVELIKELDAAGVPRALVSSSFRILVDAALEGIAPLTFNAIVAGDDVTHSKPHPEPYLTAAGRLGVDPADCVAFEDSPNGAASATAAGCRVIAVPSVVAIEPADRCVVVASVAGLDLAFLRALFE